MLVFAFKDVLGKLGLGFEFESTHVNPLLGDVNQSTDERKFSPD